MQILHKMNRLFISRCYASVVGVSFGTGMVAFCDDSDKKIFNEIEEALKSIRQEEKKIRKQWEDDEEFGFRKLPARAWPPYQPDPSQLNSLEKAAESKCSSDNSTAACHEAVFDLASCLVFNTIDPARGLQYYETQSKEGHGDSAVAAGIMFIEGIGVEISDQKGINFLSKACELGNPQAYYELGTAEYTGVTEGLVVPGKIKGGSGDSRAFQYFNMAAEKRHVGGMFMAGEMLFEGEGIDKNVKKALPLIFTAAENGHRFARQKIRQLLDKHRSS